MSFNIDMHQLEKGSPDNMMSLKNFHAFFNRIIPSFFPKICTYFFIKKYYIKYIKYFLELDHKKLLKCISKINNFMTWYIL